MVVHYNQDETARKKMNAGENQLQAPKKHHAKKKKKKKHPVLRTPTQDKALTGEGRALGLRDPLRASEGIAGGLEHRRRLSPEKARGGRGPRK